MHCPTPDSRSGAVVFACHCLLNANAKVCGLAGYGGPQPGLCEALAARQIGIIQLPCPEFLHLGPRRWWQTRNQYAVPAYARLCDRLAFDAADQAAMYAEAGYAVCGILGVEGSPSCGVNAVYDAQNWGGRPRELDLSSCKAPGRGVFTETLVRAFKERSLDVPLAGIPSSATAEAMDGLLTDLLGL